MSGREPECTATATSESLRLTPQHEVPEAEDAAVCLDVFSELLVKLVLDLDGSVIVGVLEQPLLASTAPARLEVVPLALVSGTEMQYLLPSCPSKAHHLSEGDDAIAERRGGGRGR